MIGSNSTWLNYDIRTYLRFLAIIVCYFCLIPISFTTQATTIHVVTENLEPYQFKRQDGTIDGFSTEVIQALFAITGDTADIEMMAWARAYDLARNKKNTLIYSIYRTPYREPLFHWVGPLVGDRVYFWGLKAKFPQQINSISQLKIYSAAASRESNAEQYLTAERFPKIYKVVDDKQPIKMLFKDRVDLLINTELILQQHAKDLNLNIQGFKKLIEIPELRADLSIAFSHNTDPEIISRFQQAHQQLVRSGKLAQIRKKWHINPSGNNAY